ncbi:predicted protein [Uncinocarpus reesii 1704]|uniref:Uncharacterized protein n=1 Tax=Uncinocarpus reesii (strain UAMH 1704) TaxID=336963 RepID=C4JXG2_UNCRE|nr:uncharacterized protein UREG_06335 [Uncinocarpus reesii 1704]EEP81470.1 predicted protein [Uncinocarpus reesii 1704]
MVILGLMLPAGLLLCLPEGVYTETALVTPIFISRGRANELSCRVASLQSITEHTSRLAKASARI